MRMSTRTACRFVFKVNIDKPTREQCRLQCNNVAVRRAHGDSMAAVTAAVYTPHRNFSVLAKFVISIQWKLLGKDNARVIFATVF